MGVSLFELVAYTNDLLRIQAFADYCPNGLQVQGKSNVSCIVTGVTASEALIDAAIHIGADAILVHHGYFWRGEDPVITGIKANRLKKLLSHDISLLAYHLPLDAHNQVGNNIQLARVLGFDVCGGLDDSVNPLGLVGRLKHPRCAEDLLKDISSRLGRRGLLVGPENKVVHSIAWCTGAAQSYIEKAVLKGVDCFISGEISEQTVHVARESGIVYLACGHHATERYGIEALGHQIAERFSLDCQFVDIGNPV